VPLSVARHRGSSTAPDGAPDRAPAAVTLLLPARAAVIVGGVPGAGKTTLLRRTVAPGSARVLDSAAVRDRLRRRLGARVPYALFRPLVHTLHLMAVWRALGGDDAQPVVVHDCATRRWLRRGMLRRAHRAGRPAVALLLDIDGRVARDGQRARDRCVRDRAMARHERCWRALVGAGRGERLGREGFAAVHVLDRAAADAVGALRFAPAIRQDPGMGSGYDDDDWVGTPPEGRHSRDRAKPEFWWRQRPIVPAAVGIAVVVLVIVVVAALS
jgi:predicted kinase